MANLTREELEMLGFDENGKSTLGRVNNTSYNGGAWEVMPRPRMAKPAPRRTTVQTCLHFPLDDDYSKPVAAERATELSKMVGRFVCVRGVYGLIDAVHNDRLGFVEGSADEWSSHVVPMNQVRVCTTMETEIARSSAEWYFLHECEYLHRRLAICGERERKTIADMYKTAFEWYAKVKA